MDLATVAAEDEYTNLREYVKQYHRCMKKGNVHTSTRWYIGLARDDVNSEFKWRYNLKSGEPAQCHYENFGDGKTYWGPNHPPGNAPGESQMNCVFMIAGTDFDKEEAFFASRCDYNENSDIGFVCQQRRTESQCEITETTTQVTLTSTTAGDGGGNCKVPDPTLWGNPATDCLGFGKECQIDKDLADQYQAYTREPGTQENEMPTWYTATDYCNSLGWDLATVADSTEYDSLREYVMQYERCMRKGIPTGTTFWYIGLARDHETAPFKWRYHLESGDSKHCPVEKFGDGRPYWGENNPPGSSAGDKERRCVYMRAGHEYDKNKAYFASRCDYNENSAIGFVCQKKRVKSRCGENNGGGGASTVFVSTVLALPLILL
ncbi:Oidioi.mRNA.OKI2018_I69.chr1.g486.t1.cds [Oikopleura dioica]|uniref:Oidioi.mRNA.OKI2018_I69.chr1.g486.t1.cds n=1 Tax=Oikopleura dioica TaxID=34765 RepID=A0ABN7SK10_OIKDI|nr:Oidioi.mRNA.OKI2018_I69.chr1.g486.t1.cds [Oikopleura dioica]